ncbi:MAG: sulfite exporter TauE/SafE family protein [Chloroflexi bacterium]|nr:sulfite exporter TauE/SafE family protein [Chloroflexota bacterium]
METGLQGQVAASFITLEPATVAALIILGFLGGLLSGFIGSGGAFVLTPGMMALGVDGAVAVASNMAHKFPKAMVGAWARRRLGHVDLRLGLVMGATAIVGVQVGIVLQKLVIATWGQAGSNLYISLVFVVVLWVAGSYMLRDGLRAEKRGPGDTRVTLSDRIARIKVPPLLTFNQAGTTVSFWVIVPLGFLTGLLAATIAVGGFIGVPSLIYVVGAPAFVASGTELVIASVMGLVGAFTWALDGFVDVRLTVLILVGSLFGVQVGALATMYVKESMIKVVAGAVMLMAGVSRAMVIPVYLTDLDVLSLPQSVYSALETVSLTLLFCTLLGAGAIILYPLIKGKRSEVALRLHGSPTVERHSRLP